MNRRLLTTVAACAAALGTVAFGVFILVRPIAAPSAPVSPVTPTATAAGPVRFADAALPDETAWYRIGGDPMQGPTHLTVGSLAGGVTLDLEMRAGPAGPGAIVPLRPVLGVAGGLVVIVDDDGARSVMRSVGAATGDVKELMASSDVIVNGVLAPDGRVAYFVTADRRTGDLTGTWRLTVGEQRKPEPIEELVGAAPEIRMVAVTPFFTRMLLSPDGTTLGLFRCVELDCSLRAVRTNDGSLVGEVRVPRGGGDPFAITAQSALFRPIVQDGPFRIGEVADLASGQIAPMPFDGWQFGSEAVVEGRDGPLMAVQMAGFIVPPAALGQQAAAPPEIAIIGLPDFEEQARFAPRLGSLRLLPLDDDSVGVDLPPGWILIQGSEPSDPETGAYALNVADGDVVPLPAVGMLLVQG